MGIQQVALKAVREFLANHPEEIGRAMRNALGLRFGVPLATLRWLGAQAVATGKLKALQIDAKPPGLHITLETDLMQTPIRASFVLYIDRVELSDAQALLALRVEEVHLQVTGPAETPVAALIKSGALDLSNPGTLAGYLPGRSPVLVEADGSRLVLDFMQEPKLGNNRRVRQALGLLSSLVKIHAIQSDRGHFDVVLRAFPRGVGEVVRAFNQHLVAPAVIHMLPGGR
jgi:hypothetical protein